MLPGRRFVIAGTGPFLLPVAQSLAIAGSEVAIFTGHSGLSEDERARLQSFRREVRETLPRYWRPQYEETSDNWRPQN